MCTAWSSTEDPGRTVTLTARAGGDPEPVHADSSPASRSAAAIPIAAAAPESPCRYLPLTGDQVLDDPTPHTGTILRPPHRSTACKCRSVTDSPTSRQGQPVPRADPGHNADALDWTDPQLPRNTLLSRPQLTATVTATAATNARQQRPATAHNARTISDNLAYATPEKRTVAARDRPDVDAAPPQTQPAGSSASQQAWRPAGSCPAFG
jgi:hypothetical protein